MKRLCPFQPQQEGSQELSVPVPLELYGKKARLSVCDRVEIKRKRRRCLCQNE